MHHGVWDYDLPAAPILGDIMVDGRRINAVTLLTKPGMSFVFDRTNGKPVWPIEDGPCRIRCARRALVADAAFSDETCAVREARLDEDGADRLHTLATHRSARDCSDNAGADVHADRRIVERHARDWVSPGYGGGSNWNGGAFDPETGMMYVPTRISRRSLH